MTQEMTQFVTYIIQTKKTEWKCFSQKMKYSDNIFIEWKQGDNEDEVKNRQR